MGYEDDPYRDEDGEPLMDYDDRSSDSGELQGRQQDDFLQNWGEDDGEDGNQEREKTPLYESDKVGKPRKRLLKKSGSGSGGDDDDNDGGFVAPELVDDDDDGGGVGVDDVVRGEGKKKKSFGMEEERKNIRKGEKKFGKVSSDGKRGSGSSSGSGLMMKKRKKLVSGKDDGEVKEMWDTIAGGDSEVLKIFSLSSFL